jgi:hypothetical protein
VVFATDRGDFVRSDRFEPIKRVQVRRVASGQVRNVAILDCRMPVVRFGLFDQGVDVVWVWFHGVEKVWPELSRAVVG